MTLDVMKGVLRKLSIRPFQCPRLRLGDLFARHPGGNIVAGLAGILVAGRGGKVEPHVCGYVVLRRALQSILILEKASVVPFMRPPMGR